MNNYYARKPGHNCVCRVTGPSGRAKTFASINRAVIALGMDYCSIQEKLKRCGFHKTKRGYLIEAIRDDTRRPVRRGWEVRIYRPDGTMNEYVSVNQACKKEGLCREYLYRKLFINPVLLMHNGFKIVLLNMDYYGTMRKGEKEKLKYGRTNKP